jgi:hypothetical protein
MGLSKSQCGTRFFLAASPYLAMVRCFSTLTSGSMPALPIAAIRGMLGGKNLFGAYPDGSFENAERFGTALVTRQICDSPR